MWSLHYCVLVRSVSDMNDSLAMLSLLLFVCVQVVEYIRENSIICIEADAKRSINYRVKNAKEDVKKCQDAVHGVGAKAKYIQAIKDTLWRETYNFTNKAVEEAESIKYKALNDIERLASQADSIVASAANPIDMMDGLERVLERISRVHAKAKNDLEVVDAQLDRDNKAVSAKFQKLMKVVK
jgi:hypothetical protein